MGVKRIKNRGPKLSPFCTPKIQKKTGTAKIQAVFLNYFKFNATDFLGKHLKYAVAAHRPSNKLSMAFTFSSIGFEALIQ